MTTSRAYIAACTLCLPISVAVAGVIAGYEVGVAAAFAATLGLLHLALKDRTARQVLAVDPVAGQAGAGLLVLHTLVALPAAAFLCWALGALPMAAALGTWLLGAVVFALAHAVRTADVALALTPRELEH